MKKKGVIEEEYYNGGYAYEYYPSYWGFNIKRNNKYFNSLLNLKNFSQEFIRAKELFIKTQFKRDELSLVCNICKTDKMDLGILKEGDLLVTYHNYQNSDLPIMVELRPNCKSLIKNRHYINVRIYAFRNPNQTYIRNMPDLNTVVLKFLNDINNRVISIGSKMLEISDDKGTISSEYEEQAIKDVNKLLKLNYF